MIPQDRANSSVSGAESAQIQATDSNPRADGGEKRLQRGRIAECLVIRAAALPHVDRRNNERAISRRLERKPRRAVKVDEHIRFARCRRSRSDENLGAIKLELLALDGALLQPLVRARELDHRRRILRGGFGWVGAVSDR